MCRGWIDDDMVWEIPRDERPSHVCNPWVWIPDIPITDVVVQLQTVDELMDHLRTIPRYDCTASATRALRACCKSSRPILYSFACDCVAGLYF